jgi:hypothetical protein
MKQFLLVLLCSATVIASGQTGYQQIKNINTVEQAQRLVDANPGADIYLMPFVEGADSAAIASRIFSRRISDTLSDEKYLYKVIDTVTTLFSRVTYIYIDGATYSLRSIDSIRTVIMSKYKSGTPVKDLVKEYTMDGNPTGDLGWFSENQMTPGFGAAVRQHVKGDLFTVDIPDKKWYYVVLKTYDDRMMKLWRVLRVKK